MKDEKKVPAIRFKGFTDAWEQRKLEKLGKFFKGKGYSKSDLTPQGTPIILYGNLYTNYQFSIQNVSTFTQLKENSVISKGHEIIFPASGETAEDIARASAVKKQGIILGGDLNIMIPNPEIESEFLALEISNNKIKKALAQKAQGKSVVHIHNTDIQSLNILLTKTSEQIKIIDIFLNLDNLITLHQRYKYEQIFKEPNCLYCITNAWEQRELENIVNRFDNLRVPVAESLRKKGNIPYYGANGIQGYVDGYTHNGEFILIAEDGANDLNNYPVRYVNGKIWVNNHAHVIQSKQEKSNNLFISFALSSADIKSLIVGGSRSKLTASSLMQIILIVPLIKEQQKIGIFLNTIESLLTLHQRKFLTRFFPK